MPLRITLAVVCSLLIFGVHCSGEGFTHDELYCQEASADLLQCCPRYDPSMTYCDQGSDPQSQSSSSCLGSNSDTVTMYPTLSLAEGQCILNETCDELVSSGVCARAMHQEHATRETTTSGCGGSSEQTTYEDAVVDADFVPPAHESVCP
jgi:hypothetical protein